MKGPPNSQASGWDKRGNNAAVTDREEETVDVQRA